MSLDVAEALLTVGRVDQARSAVVEVLAGEPENVEALCLLARCHQAANDYPEMLVASGAAAHAAPDNFEAHLLRSQALLQLDRVDEAIAASVEAIRLAPESASAYLTYACALLVANRRRAGWAAMREATRLAPEWPTVHFVAGAAHHSMGGSRKARAAYERTLRLQPDHAGARQGLGQLAMTAGRLGSAIRHLGAAAVTPEAESAGPGIDRVLRGLAGNAMVAAWFVALILVFGQLPLVWLIALIPIALYGIWVARVARSLPAALSAGVRLRLGTDPRLRWRIWLAVITLVLAVAGGLYQLLNPVPDNDPRPLVFLTVTIGWWLAGAVAVMVVDRREAKRLRPPPGTRATDPAIAELALSELTQLDFAGLMLRWLPVTAIVTVVPWVLAISATPWWQRAVTGAAAMGLLYGYYRWSRRRWSRRPRQPASPSALPLLRVADIVLGLLWLGLPLISFWPGAPPDIVLVLLFVAISGSLLSSVAAVIVSLIRRLRRSTVDG